MLVRQLNDGRAEVRTSTRAPSSATATRRPSASSTTSSSFARASSGAVWNAARQRAPPPRSMRLGRRGKWTSRTKPCRTTRRARAARFSAALKRPTDCKVFGTACTPSRPWARAWCRPKARVRRITRMVVCSKRRFPGRWRHSHVQPKWGRGLDFEAGRVDMTHGSGGKVDGAARRRAVPGGFDNPLLAKKNDQALFEVPAGRWCMTTDGVRRFAALLCRRRHRVARCPRDHQRRRDGGRPSAVSLGVVHSRGRLSAQGPSHASSSPWPERRARRVGPDRQRETPRLSRRARGTACSSRRRGSASFRLGSCRPPGDRARPGDVIIVSGTMGDHGVAILSSREGHRLPRRRLRERLGAASPARRAHD